VYFGAASDLSTLLDDIALVRPTKMTFVPRIWEIIHDRVDAEAARLCGDGADRTDLERATAPELRRQFIGDRCLSATTGSAPIAPALKAWLESFLGLHVADTLGSTETGAILVDGRVRRPPVLDYRLIDVPELGYFGTDRPYPRGELLVRTGDLIAGYYARPELTAAMCDEDGFYRTGDVVAEIAPDHLQFVDRRNGVLKLAQGEFVQVAQLEGIFTLSPWISQCYVYGSGARSYLLAVVVPTADALREVGADPGELKHLLAESIRELARHNGLQSYELPRDFIVETEPFTRDNGLLTGIGKLARPAVKQAYEAALEKRYDELASGLTAALLTLRADAADAPVLETVLRAAQALLGVFDTEVGPDAHFTDLGGDSMSALVFADTLSDALGVDVPVDVIVSPATDLRSLAAYVDRLRGSGQTRPTHRSVHGADTTAVHARDLVLDKFIDEATLSRVPQAQVRQGRPTTVLLTGATGFLGRYLALEWLSRIEDAGNGHLICLVRADDESSARKRLENAFGSGSSAMLERFRQLAAGRLEIVVGDKSEPDLGVEACEWRRLADTVDLIVDSAAMVNHVLPYGQLFGPNVAGTAELIRLALNGIRKPYAYVSTIGVGAGIEPSLFTEDADIRTIGATRALDDGYANGYAASKWAGEVLLREAHERFALPVAVFRCNMILADSSYPAQLNVSDVFTRTIASLAATGVAPESFYEGGRQRAHYDGLPVGFVARAISALSSSIEVFQTYHVINPHDDGVGLDEFVDWLVEAGCPVTRISDYARWLERFETSLRALPAHQRAVSLLPLLHHYRRPLSARSPGWIAERFRAATREAGIAPDIPGLSRAVIAKYVDDLRLLGLLPAP
ncbi:MAG: fatty acid CoA ligase FadD9, partial [Streptomyces sp.]|jgi:fatty acid CoA ligase FadD9|nr:fatty acid CoA ligase FadD9 [Streptomyces sp.]